MIAIDNSYASRAQRWKVSNSFYETDMTLDSTKINEYRYTLTYYI